MGTLADPSGSRRRPPGRLLVGLGIVLALLGPVLYAVQLRAHVLRVPWYLPILGTVGALLVVIALVRARTFTRAAVLLVLGLFAGMTWWVLVSAMKLPTYAGPVAVGQPFPAFTATRADGSAFNQDDLRGAQNTLLVFFRGRW